MSNLFIALLMYLSVTSEASPRKRFSGGTDVTTNDFPWVGSLQQNISGTWTHICGLVAATNFSVGASHCYPSSASSSDYRMVFDTLDLSNTSSATITTISSVFRDINFDTNGPGYRYDNIEFRAASQVTTNPLPPPTGVPLDQAGLQCEVYGWGKQDDGTYPTILQKRNVTLISRADCQARVTSLGANITSLDTCVDGDVISEGDSGNPLVCFGGTFGVASWSYGGDCTGAGAVSIFTASLSFFS